MDGIREELLDEVRKFFVGPRSGDEETLEGNKPLDMYTTGVLFPTNAPQEEADKDGDKDAGGDDDITKDDDNESEKYLKQNSIGLRVDIKDGVKKIQIAVSYGKYVPNDSGGWKRTELDKKKQECPPIELNGSKEKIIICDDDGKPESKISWRFYPSRKKTHLGQQSFNTLNVFLENLTIWQESDAAKDGKNSKGKKKDGIDPSEAIRLNNENSIFQPSITLRGTSDGRPFKSISAAHGQTHKTHEEDLFDMLYRNKKVFGAGYACAAKWEDNDDPAFVTTAIIPTFEEDQVAKYGYAGKNVGSRAARVDVFDLSCFEDLDNYETNRATIRKKLSPLVEQYARWITDQEKIIPKEIDDKNFQVVAKENMKKCRMVQERMDAGLKLLTEESGEEADRILKAFILANRSMMYQHLHFKFALNTFKGKDEEWPDVKKPGQMFWHPFQIAFILMSLHGIAYKLHDDRDVTDLIWFPTGGGKTEAYLGVAAFAMILRRLRGEVEEGLGVSVIMRYTLRLLTLQQFERASTLVCALEHLRRENHGSNGLGKEPFLLGMWVGYSMTPNLHQASEKALEELKDDQSASPADGSPWQTNYCPWCGEKVTPYPNYKFDYKTKWTLLRCTNTTGHCIFTDTKFSHDKILPLVTVDSDVYTRCPSMIIATVDKFARLPFRPETANIFGRARRKCDLHGFLPKEKYRGVCEIEGAGAHRGTSRASVHDINSHFPPDLIIQDELHLISGPLGTMVGLYETAVDFLTTSNIDGKTVRPKVIASTATIKSASEQVRKIFNRKNTIFPPPGTDIKDSFFSWQTGKKGKMFVGISFSQRSGKYALGKLYAALLQRMQIIRSSKRKTDEEIDPYWTLVGYYNSIRELGGANRLVEDDVVNNIKFLANAADGNTDNARDLGSPGGKIDELTSRKTQRQIGEIRAKLEKTITESPDDVMSILCATNMISVGFDSPRLALMAINGQTKTATEYIQVTGRIGRTEKAPGIVFVLFNPYKPRDLSHYENFVGFHSTMQKQVEQSSLTPFSVPAYTRGLHAVLIAIIRLTNPYLAGNKEAHRFEMKDGEAATDFILSRYKKVEQVDEDSTSYKDFKNRLTSLQEEWKKFVKDTAENNPQWDGIPVWYYNPWNKYDPDGKKENKNVLMIEFPKCVENKSDSYPLCTPDSLRDVEHQLDMEYV